MTNKITCTFSIVEEIADRRKTSLSYFTPEPKYETITGTYSNCDFLLDPRNSEIIISGVDYEEIEECALHIIRILNRHQDWKFCYTEFQTECGEHDSSVNLYSGYKDVRLSVRIVRGFDKTDFQRSINEEYKLPVFLNILLKEAISNFSRGKYRIAFFLIYSALERVCKLLFVHHYGENIKKNTGIDDMLQKLVDDPKINLKINIRDFENKNQRKLKGDNNFNYRDIRNAIGHGDSDSFIKNNLKADINKETKSLLRTVDNIFSEISTLINIYKNHL